jgi:hypothetical protein
MNKFNDSERENYFLVGCDAVYSCTYLLTFKGNMPLPT